MKSADTAAWLVHLYTASGAVLAFLALQATVRADYRLAFLWLFVAVVVDSSDGWLARRARVAERLPQFDGTRLDDLVDYLTFVFVPAFLLYHAGLLPAVWGLGVACAILLASAYAFAARDAKTADHFFTGFPSYWNVVAFYLYAFRISPSVNALLVLVFCGLVFVRTLYVYPSRTPALRATTVLLCSAWGAVLLYILWRLPAIDRLVLGVSLFFPIYYFGLSVALHLRRPLARRSGPADRFPG